MKKVFISQPMGGIRESQILKTNEKAKEYVESVLGEEVEIIDSFFDYAPLTKYRSRGPIWCLGELIKLMADADIVVFAPGWWDARGCKIEHQVALEYGIKIIY